MIDAVRGAAVFFGFVFKDETGNPVAPSSAKVRITYKRSGAITTDDVDLTDAGSFNWTTTWDSSVADAGTIAWWAQSTPSPKSALQGSFLLQANLANPQI